MYSNLKVQTGLLDRVDTITVWIAGDRAMIHSF